MLGSRFFKTYDNYRLEISWSVVTHAFTFYVVANHYLVRAAGKLLQFAKCKVVGITYAQTVLKLKTNNGISRLGSNSLYVACLVSVAY